MFESGSRRDLNSLRPPAAASAEQGSPSRPRGRMAGTRALVLEPHDLRSAALRDGSASLVHQRHGVPSADSIDGSRGGS